MVKTIKELREKDQFFTKDEVSKKCISVAQEYIDIIRPSLQTVSYVEPAAGNGDFYYNIDSENKVAFDIDKPKHIEDDSYIEMDFLNYAWVPKDTIFIGNPPFGKRGFLAFDFVMRAIELKSSMIAFILPPNVNTDARLKLINNAGYYLVHSEELASDSFYFDNNRKQADMDADSVFQIYIKKEYIDLYNISVVENISLKNSDFVQVYTINTNVIKNKSRDVGDIEFIQDGIGKDWIDKCDFYLPLRVFSSKGEPEYYDDFLGTHNVGFGIICEDKDMKNKIDINNCFRLGMNKVNMSKKQLILKEIMRIKDNEKGDE